MVINQFILDIKKNEIINLYMINDKTIYYRKYFKKY